MLHLNSTPLQLSVSSYVSDPLVRWKQKWNRKVPFAWFSLPASCRSPNVSPVEHLLLPALTWHQIQQLGRMVTVQSGRTPLLLTRWRVYRAPGTTPQGCRTHVSARLLTIRRTQFLRHALAAARVCLLAHAAALGVPPAYLVARFRRLRYWLHEDFGPECVRTTPWFVDDGVVLFSLSRVFASIRVVA